MTFRKTILSAAIAVATVSTGDIYAQSEESAIQEITVTARKVMNHMLMHRSLLLSSQKTKWKLQALKRPLTSSL